MEARAAIREAGAAPVAERTGVWHRSVVALGPRRLITVVLLLVGGGLIITVGGVLSDEGYLSSALLEIGAALFLAVPLILLERLLSGRIEGAQAKIDSVAEDVHRAQTKIDQLGEETRSRIAARRASDTELLDRLRADASERNVRNALQRAQEFSALDGAGVRVRIPGSSLRMRFNTRAAGATDAGSVDISVEDRDGRQISGFESWSEDEFAADALVALVEDLWRRGAYPSDERFDATQIFKRLASALETVMDVWTCGDESRPLGRLIELDGAWALTQYGVEHLHDPTRRVATRDLLDDPKGARATLVTGDEELDATVDEVLKTAIQYHKGVAQRTADQRAPRR